MADSVHTRLVRADNDRAEYHFMNISDGTGESAVLKVDISALPSTPTLVSIEWIEWTIIGMQVNVLFDHTTDDLILSLLESGKKTFGGGLADPASAGATGDILFTTVGHSSGDIYDIRMGIVY